MHVRLLRGDFFKVDGFAIQDFEQLPTGEVVVPQPALGIVDFGTGQIKNGGCSLDYATLLPRQQ
jgi:hypothetical protein